MSVDVDALVDRIVERLRADRDDRPLLSISQAAVRLGMSDRTVREMVGSGRLASLKVEGARRVEQSEIDRYLARARGESADG